MLDWLPNADHVGIYQALADGAFKAAGLDVTVRTPANPASPLQLLQAGKVDVAISYEPELMLARDKGAPLVAIARDRPAAADLDRLAGLQAHHLAPAQLQGKRVGDAGIPYQHAYLKTILAHAGVPAELGQRGQRRRQPRRLDAVRPGRRHARRLLELRGDPAAPGGQAAQRHPRRERRRAQLRRARARHHREGARAPAPTELRRFVQALARGYQAVRANPQAGVDALLKANPRCRPSSSRRASPRPCRRSSPPADRPWGWMTTSQWTAYGQWMLRQHLISNPATIVGRRDGPAAGRPGSVGDGPAAR